MWGTHPKTGKPIRILQTETSISKDRKTIVWLGAEIQANSWSRWEVGAFSREYLTPSTNILLLCDSAMATADAAWLRTGAWKDLTMILAARDTLNLLGENALKEMGVGNLICLEEIADIYPFVGPAWDSTANDAALLASILMRMNRAFGLNPSPLRSESMIKAIPELPADGPPQLWLISQFYRPDKPSRAREISLCLQKNLACPYVDKIVLLNETDLSKYFPDDSSNKIQEEVIGKRLTYAAVIRWIAEKAPTNTLCVFANSDIYLDETWKALWSTAMEDRFLSLLRYEAADGVPDAEHKLFGPRADSQDTWVVLSDSVKSRTWDYKGLDFSFGRAGCDNAINVEMLRTRFLVANPALTLKTHHVHTSEIRTYDPQDIVDKPMYFYIQPTGLHDMNPLFNLKADSTITSLPFSRPILGANPTHTKTFCAMVSRGEKYKLAAEGENIFTPDPIPIYEANEVFQTPTGLAYTYSSLYVGKSKAGSEAWNKSHISGLSPSLVVDVGLIAPLPDEFAVNSASYVLMYLANVLLLREKAGGKGEFWSPREKPFLNALQMFNWNQREVPVLPRDESIQVFCKKGYIMLPSDSPTITRNHVAALRDALRGWCPTPTEEKRCIIFYDEVYCTREFINELEQKLQGYDIRVVWPATENIVAQLAGASLLVTGGGKASITRWGWSWILPKGAQIVEIQNEMEPTADCLHLAAAAEVRHSLCICPKVVGPRLVDDVLKAMTIKEPVKAPVNTKPLLILPDQAEGSFFGHAGDSFRELARMWMVKGYVKIVEDKHAHHVWLHGIGNTLLYDRPTYEWLEQSPPDERKYKMALFGNPAPPSGSTSKSWSFWPRRPAIVEEMSTTTAPATPFGERQQTLVLYGRIENATQKKRRPMNWAAACSEFVMPVGGDKAYPFSQREYLEKLTEAKFGLCLPGYGWKCHREVECMAMGCVPIVSPDVDMANYAQPPVKDVHYFVAATPEDARRLATTTDEETWAKMSAAGRDWWKENCSCDGMWALTQKLLA
jgi:hypothetical protein